MLVRLKETSSCAFDQPFRLSVAQKFEDGRVQHYLAESRDSSITDDNAVGIRVMSLTLFLKIQKKLLL